MARSGLSALSVRIVLKAWIPPAPQSEAIKLMRDTWDSRRSETAKREKLRRTERERFEASLDLQAKFSVQNSPQNY
jgi:hypothetical protein